MKTAVGKVEGALQKAGIQQGDAPVGQGVGAIIKNVTISAGSPASSSDGADKTLVVPSGGNPSPESNEAPDLKDANSHNLLSTANMYAEFIDDSGTFLDMGTSRSYMAPTDPVWSAFLSPYYGKSGQNNGSVHSKGVGLSMRATRFLNDQTLFGFSASISRAMSDSAETDSTATNYAVGMHAMYMFNDSAYIRGQFTGTFGQSDSNYQKDLYGQRLAADADMNSYGLYTQMAVGYSFVFGNSGGAGTGDGSGADSGSNSARVQAAQHTVRPKLSLSYFYNHMDGYSAQYYDGSMPTSYGFSVRSADYDALYTDLTVSWTGAFDLVHGKKDYGFLKPTVKVGVRQALTDPEVLRLWRYLGFLPCRTHQCISLYFLGDVSSSKAMYDQGSLTAMVLGIYKIWVNNEALYTTVC